MKVAAIIPARKGSKRIPKKNHHAIDGEHLINKVIKNLEKSSNISNIYITTDDEELKKKIDNKDIKFLLRNPKYCDDYTSVVDLIRNHYFEDLKGYDAIFQTYIHAISIDANTIDNAIQKLMDSDKNFLISISRMNVPVEWTFKKKNKKLISNFPAMQNIRSQDLGESFFDAGQFYGYKSKWFSENESNEYENCAYLEIKDFQAIDLDVPEDIEKLEYSYHYAKRKISGLY